ncbi:MAG: hypothetical protein KUL74_04170, partial [Cloacibacterium sp.]|nr:hypothetical protein [Cloacibacterium sp.]
MQKLQETQERLFAEIKELISKISSFSNEEDFIAEVGVFTELQEKVISLKNYSEMLSVIRAEENVEQDIERQVINFEIDTKKVDDFSQPVAEIEEELEEEPAVEENAVAEKLDEEYFIEKEQNINELAENIEKEKEQEISEITLAKEEMEKKDEEERLHEERRKIIDIPAPVHHHEEKPEPTSEEKTVSQEESHHETKEHHEKKFKLAHIKGLKATVQSLFDDDPLEHIQEKIDVTHIPEEKKAPSLLKTNLPTDYMEAEKTLPDFKLDINDRIAFT